MNSSFVINGYRYDFRYRVSTSLKELVGWLVDIPGVTATGNDLDELTEALKIKVTEKMKV